MPPKTTPVRRRRRRVPWFFFWLIVVTGVSFWQSWAWWRWSISPTTALDKSVQLQIPQGTSSQKIGQNLESLGLIRSQKAWKIWSLWLRFSQQGGSFKAGTYLLDFNDDLPAIAATIWQGNVVQTSITIPEGWSLQQMAEYFEGEGLFAAEDFLAATKQIPRDQFGWLPPNIPYLEGFLYPDTYFLNKDDPEPQAIIEQMLTRFEEVALPLYNNADVPLDLSLNEWVTLASIVEKEAVVADERTTISGVFANRLQRGMKLETDPTVEYALNIRQTKEQPLTFEQIKVDSPYNTYRYTGLPPTAIAAPGLASLKATLEPAATDYLFFVARYDGTHVFSKTLAEHESATKEIRASIP
ncbi:aminodeoxychorismate lyase [[Leptolyngbya] sp. PCC 7376]|uniref:endolytic transglycosylase MltG n=1 Tax=[Leptolyngbya] sp. PCC 7376 TaxID=111781 RepID=UPI00029EDCFD|nr:endolytic transglycosylase MltG [[Leptolyngbya] sp. PCC 7376]AFY39091.1 aminodeoxychorismate lyase [[Leptolyngbya] sp. PCC 7376]